MIGAGWETGKGNSRQIGDNLTIKDNSAALMKALSANLERALEAVGTEAVGMVRQKMDTGYTDAHPNRNAAGKPTGGTHTAIRASSALYQSIQYDTEGSDTGGTVVVGTNVEYAMFVHEGTRFLRKRPFIRDALEGGIDRLQQICATELKQGI